MGRKPKPPLTVQQVVAIAKRDGKIHVNPMKYSAWRGLAACRQAVALGLLRRKRVKLDLLIFYPAIEARTK
jgi:hypothetical protein